MGVPRLQLLCHELKIPPQEHAYFPSDMHRDMPGMLGHVCVHAESRLGKGSKSNRNSVYGSRWL